MRSPARERAAAGTAAASDQPAALERWRRGIDRLRRDVEGTEQDGAHPLAAALVQDLELAIP